MCIINPWYFYLSNLSDNFQTLSICVFIIAIIAMISFIIGWVCVAIEDGSFERGNNELPLTKFLKRMAKISTVATIVSAILMTVLPSEDTINKMVISSFVTKENITEAKTGAKELVDYIVEKAAELKNAESNNKQE
jgi:hypothetical protein